MTTATITRIEDNDGIKTVNLEWHGLDDHTIEDFDLDQLGQRCKGIGKATGGNLTSGWVVLEGDCLLNEGDTIPLLPSHQLSNSDVAAHHANEYVTVKHRANGHVFERTLGALLSEAANQQAFTDMGLDEDRITIGQLRDFLCDYTITL